MSNHKHFLSSSKSNFHIQEHTRSSFFNSRRASEGSNLRSSLSKCGSSKKAFEKIVNFTDRNEIQRAISTLESTSDKMNLIDLIMEEQSRIRNMNRKIKMAQINPLMQNFRKKYVANSFRRQGDPKTDRSEVSKMYRRMSIGISILI